jgi:hypothetical protein
MARKKSNKKWIQKAVSKMKKKGTVGSLTAIAKREGGWDAKNKRIKKTWLRKKAKGKGKVAQKARFALNVNK